MQAVCPSSIARFVSACFFCLVASAYPCRRAAQIATNIDDLLSASPPSFSTVAVEDPVKFGTAVRVKTTTTNHRDTKSQ